MWICRELMYTDYVQAEKSWFGDFVQPSSWAEGRVLCSIFYDMATLNGGGNMRDSIAN